MKIKLFLFIYIINNLIIDHIFQLLISMIKFNKFPTEKIEFKYNKASFRDMMFCYI